MAYREQAESNALWRWLGAQAPDLVLIAGDEDSGLAAALAAQEVSGMGSIPARRWSGAADLSATPEMLAMSGAHAELERRRARSPRQLAEELTQYYGRDFDQPWYIGAIALIARVRLGELDDVQRLVEP